MADRTCDQCGKAFDYPVNLARHRHRKSPCAPILEEEDLPASEKEKQHKCPYCGRRFTTFTSMRRHVRDRCAIAPNEKNGEAGMEVLYEHVVKRQADQIEELQKQAQVSEIRREELVTMLKQLAQPSSSSSSVLPTSQTQIGGTGNIQTSVVLNVWGQENVARIAAADIRTVLEEGGGTNAAVCGILRLIYHKTPENRNAYLPNKKESTAMVFEGSGPEDGRWIPRSRASLLPKMVEKSVDVAFNHQFAILADDATPSEVRSAMDRAAKDLARDCPINGEISPSLLSGVSSEQKSILLANRPEKN